MTVFAGCRTAARDRVGTSLIDGFRYAMLGMPVLLPTGTYTIGALYASNSNDGFVNGATTVTAASGLIYNGPRSTFGDAFPSFSGPANSYFGPNFQFTTGGSAVPESGATLWLLIGSVIALCVLRRRAVRAH